MNVVILSILKWYIIVSLIYAILFGILNWYDSIVYKDWIEEEIKTIQNDN